jgi:hypothetical protein
MHVADAPIPLTTAMIHPRASFSRPMSLFSTDVGSPSFGCVVATEQHVILVKGRSFLSRARKYQCIRQSCVKSEDGTSSHAQWRVWLMAGTVLATLMDRAQLAVIYGPRDWLNL